MNDSQADPVCQVNNPNKVPNDVSDPNAKEPCRHFITREHASVPGFRRQLYATVAVSFGAFSSGNVLGWSGPMVLKMRGNETTIGETFDVGSFNTMLTIMAISSMLGMMACGYLMDTVGRRAGCWFLTLFAPAGWVFLAQATTHTDLYVGGALVGSILAAGPVVGVVILTEVTNDNVRGPLLTLLVFFHSCGALFSHIFGEFLSYKTYNLTCLVVSLALPSVFTILPESPLFLILKSQKAEAKASIEWYHGNDSEVVEIQMQKLQTVQMTPRLQFISILSTRGGRFSLMIILFLSVISELCGTTVIEIYTGTILLNIYQDREDIASKVTLILAFFRFFAGIVTVFVVEKAGRKFILSKSLITMTVSLMILAAILAQTQKGGDPASVWWVCALLCIYTWANQMNLAAGEVVTGEVSSNDTRGMLLAIGGVARVLTLIFCLQIHTILSSSSYYGNYVFHAVCCLLGVNVVKVLMPETRGKTMAEIWKKMETRICSEGP